MRNFPFTVFFIGVYAIMLGITILAFIILEDIVSFRMLALSGVFILGGLLGVHIGWKDKR